MTKVSILKNCYKCGSDQVYLSQNTGNKKYRVECIGCNEFVGEMDFKGDTVFKWNSKVDAINDCKECKKSADCDLKGEINRCRFKEV